MTYDRTNTGTIAKNDRKEEDTHPDLRGKINIEGVDYYLDGWRKQRASDGATFYSLRAKPVEQIAKPAGDSARTMPRHGQQIRPLPDDDEDSIPF